MDLLLGNVVRQLPQEENSRLVLGHAHTAAGGVAARFDVAREVLLLAGAGAWRARLGGCSGLSEGFGFAACSAEP